MNNTIYASTMGSVMELKRLDVVANNLANVDTPGFKSDRAYFRSTLAYLSDREGAAAGGAGNVNNLLAVTPDFSQGAIQTTNNPMDVAIRGEGFFVVQDGPGGGEMYTRAGNLKINSQGLLVTAEGRPVLGAGGPIQLQLEAGVGEARIDEDGSVMVGENQVDRLRVVRFPDQHGLQKKAGTNFVAQAQPIDVDQPELAPGSLEGSNVNPVRTMSELVQINRTFEAYQQIISMVNKINEQSTQRLARVA